MGKDWKDRLGIVYSTDPDFNYSKEEAEEMETLSPGKQHLSVLKDNKKRKGKTVTIVKGFIGSEDDLKDLAKQIKVKCGVGGSVKNEEIIIQGNCIEKVKNILKKEGYNLK